MNEINSELLVDADTAEKEKISQISKGLIFQSIEDIPDETIKLAVKYYFNCHILDYFWYVPASQSGLYHPKFSNGKGGLVRHTITAFNIAKNLYESNILNNAFYINNSLEFSCILAAILIHDTYKLGYTNGDKTVYSHGSIAADEFYNFCRNNKNCDLSDEILNNICDAVASHMGKWCRIQPISKISKVVSLCDYLSAQKTMEVFYDEDVLRFK